MKTNHVFRSAVAALATLLWTAAPMLAQCGQDSSRTLTGTWSFQMTSGPVRMAGQFRITPGAPNTGRANLTVVSTAVSAGGVTRSDNGLGQILYNAYCTGGTIFFYQSFAAIEAQFRMPSDPKSPTVFIYNPLFKFVNTGEDYTRDVCTGTPAFAADCGKPYPWPDPALPPSTKVQLSDQWGEASPAPSACPADPRTLVSTNSPRFNGVRVAGISLLEFNPASVDAFGALRGTMDVTLAIPTTPQGGTFNPPPGWTPNVPVAAYKVTGQYQIAPDCARNIFYLYGTADGGYLYDAYPYFNGSSIEFFAVGTSLNRQPLAVSQGKVGRTF